MNRTLGMLFLATALIVGAAGCDNRGKADIPKEMIEIPKEGPVAAGAGPARPKGKAAEKKEADTTKPEEEKKSPTTPDNKPPEKN